MKQNIKQKHPQDRPCQLCRRPADPRFESHQIVGAFFTNHGSQNGQGIIFHQPRFPSNSRGISLTIRNLLGEIGRVSVTMKFDQRICVTLKHRNSMSQHNLPQVFEETISQKTKKCPLKKGPFNNIGNTSSSSNLTIDIPGRGQLNHQP